MAGTNDKESETGGGSPALFRLTPSFACSKQILVPIIEKNDMHRIL